MGDEVAGVHAGVGRQRIGDLVDGAAHRVLRGVRIGAVERDEDADGDLQAGWIAFRALEGRAKVAEADMELIGLVGVSEPGGVPLVGMLHHEVEHAGLLAGDEDRRAARDGSVRGSSSLSTARWYRPSKVTRPSTQERDEDLQRLVEARDAVVEREAEGVELRLVPATTHTEDEASVADLVELGRHLRRQRRVAEGERQHERADLDPRRDRGKGREHGPALVDALRLAVVAEDEVIGAPDRVQAAVFGGDRHVAQAGIPVALVVPEGQHQSDLHAVNASGARARTPRYPHPMSQLPLEGIRVIDASRVLAGPFATMLLGDLGADVIKIEPPAGDETRTWGPPWWGSPQDRRSAYFASVNRNKRSVVLDLREPGGQETLHRLLETADLLVHNYRPRTALRLGLEADDLAARHPRLVVASVGGFPGADADRPAYDLLAQAVSGLMSVTGEPDGPPMKVGVALLDLLAGLECAVGALAALVGRGRTRRVEVSLVEVGVTSLINVLGNHLASGSDALRHGNAHPNIAPYEAFEAIDGHLVIAVGNDAQFGRLLDVLGLKDVDGRYASNPRRVAAREELATWLGGRIRGWQRGALVQALIAADVPAGPVNSVREAVDAMGSDWTLNLDGIAARAEPDPHRGFTGALAPRTAAARAGHRRGARRAGSALAQRASNAIAARRCCRSRPRSRAPPTAAAAPRSPWP